MGEFVHLEVDDGVGVIRIDRPPANAFDRRVGVELGETVREAQERSDVGALVVWGGYPGRHVAILLELGEDPLLCSHGHERGPIAIRFSDESRYQPERVTWLRGLS